MSLIATTFTAFAQLHLSTGSFTAPRTAYLECDNKRFCVERRLLEGRPVVRVASGAAPSWRFVRAKGPAETGEVVSITKTADMEQSGPDFAGLMVRCISKGRIDVLVVLISPLPPQTRPQVIVTAGQTSKTFEGKVAAAGAAVVLPEEAAVLVSGPWQTVPQLTISVRDKENEIKGVVALDGLRPAYANLIGACAQ